MSGTRDRKVYDSGLPQTAQARMQMHDRFDMRRSGVKASVNPVAA